MITSLQNNQVLVFGSNSNGFHVGGAAKQAYEQFGAVWGKGEGLHGQSYAFPTLAEDMSQLMEHELQDSVKKLYKCCEQNKDKQFLLTPVGTGIAGFSTKYMKSLFTNPPNNLVLPIEFI